MEPPDHSRAYKISNRAEAVALDHPVRSRLLMACALQERSLTELAKQTGQPLSKLHYHMGRLLACGLLRVSRSEPRAGRPVRYYRALAESFLISMADMAAPVSDAWTRELRQSLAEEPRDAGRQFLVITVELDHVADMTHGELTPRIRHHASSICVVIPSVAPPGARQAPPRVVRHSTITPDSRSAVFESFRRVKLAIGHARVGIAAAESTAALTMSELLSKKLAGSGVRDVGVGNRTG